MTIKQLILILTGRGSVSSIMSKFSSVVADLNDLSDAHQKAAWKASDKAAAFEEKAQAQNAKWEASIIASDEARTNAVKIAQMFDLEA